MNILKQLNKHKQWVFQGIGVTVITGSLSCAMYLFMNYKIVPLNGNGQVATVQLEPSITPVSPIKAIPQLSPSPSNEPKDSSIKVKGNGVNIAKLDRTTGSVIINQGFKGEPPEEEVIIPSDYVLPSFVQSSVKADYRKLGYLLQIQDFKKADSETYRMIEWVAGYADANALFAVLVYDAPCSELSIMDRLWSYYSGGKFGFSVQQEIVENIFKLNPALENPHYTWLIDGKALEIFGSKVEWKDDVKWKYYNDSDFSINAVKGHLPRLVGNEYHAIHAVGKFRDCSLKAASKDKFGKL